MDTRQAQLLNFIVDQYTKTAQPVGSKLIAEMGQFDLSPATIRHEMALLEPFLKARQSVFVDVQKAVLDSEAVQPGRRDSLLELYKVLRAESMAGMGKSGAERTA